MLLSNLSELWSAVGRWSVVGGCWLFVSGNFRTICHCMLLLPERLLLVVFIVFLLCSALFCAIFFSLFLFFFLGEFIHGETVETHYTNADLRSQTTYGFN